MYVSGTVVAFGRLGTSTVLCWAVNIPAHTMFLSNHQGYQAVCKGGHVLSSEQLRVFR